LRQETVEPTNDAAPDPTPDAPVVAVRRGDLVESVHRGRYVIRDAGGGTLGSLGDPKELVHLRSSAKPFQALPLVFSGAADAFGLTSEEIAVACASHNAEARHLSVVRSILRKAGLSEADLRSGAVDAQRQAVLEQVAQRARRAGELAARIEADFLARTEGAGG